jgi:hypothetical protein
VPAVEGDQQADRLAGGVVVRARLVDDLGQGLLELLDLLGSKARAEARQRQDSIRPGIGELGPDRVHHRELTG